MKIVHGRCQSSKLHSLQRHVRFEGLTTTAVPMFFTLNQQLKAANLEHIFNFFLPLWIITDSDVKNHPGVENDSTSVTSDTTTIAQPQPLHRINRGVCASGASELLGEPLVPGERCRGNSVDVNQCLLANRFRPITIKMT